MGRTRSEEKVVDTAKSSEGSGDITYTNGPLPEVWIASGDAHSFELITLPDSKTSKPRQYVRIERSGQDGPKASLGEVRTFQNSSPASFLVEEKEEEAEEKKQSGSTEAKHEEGQSLHKHPVFTTKQALHFVTDIDLTFMLLPVLCPVSSGAGKDETRRLFAPFDDIMDTWSGMQGSQAAGLNMGQEVMSALQRVCDCVDAGGENAYRFSQDKFQDMIMTKAKAMVDSGLPASLNERAMKLVESSAAMAIPPEAVDSPDVTVAVNTPGELSDTQESAVSAVFSQADPSSFSTLPSFATETCANELEIAARTRVAFAFILSNYVPPHISAETVRRLDQQDVTSFQSLRDHIQSKREAENRMDLARSFSLKRGANEEELLEARAEKKRKLDEEEKKRKETSQAVKALAKVNTKGMKKMTSFFTTKPKTT